MLFSFHPSIFIIANAQKSRGERYAVYKRSSSKMLGQIEGLTLTWIWIAVMVTTRRPWRDLSFTSAVGAHRGLLQLPSGDIVFPLRKIESSNTTLQKVDPSQALTQAVVNRSQLSRQRERGKQRQRLSIRRWPRPSRYPQIRLVSYSSVCWGWEVRHPQRSSTEATETTRERPLSSRQEEV